MAGGEILTPRVDVIAVEDDLAGWNWPDIFAESGYSRRASTTAPLTTSSVWYMKGLLPSAPSAQGYHAGRPCRSHPLCHQPPRSPSCAVSSHHPSHGGGGRSTAIFENNHHAGRYSGRLVGENLGRRRRATRTSLARRSDGSWIVLGDHCGRPVRLGLRIEYRFQCGDERSGAGKNLTICQVGDQFSRWAIRRCVTARLTNNRRVTEVRLARRKSRNRREIKKTKAALQRLTNKVNLRDPFFQYGLSTFEKANSSRPQSAGSVKTIIPLNARLEAKRKH